MMKPTDGPSTTSRLPSFLDTSEDGGGTDPAAAHEVVNEDAEAPADGSDPAATTGEFDDGGLVDAPMDGSDATIAEPAPTVPRRQRARARTRRAGGGGIAALATAFAGAGLAVAAVPSLGDTLPPFVHAPSLIVLATVLFTGAICIRRIGALRNELDDQEERRAEANAALLEDIQRLLPAQTDTSGLQHLRLAMQRQDEKVNNLTKAIKMYGKPLMEIASQCAEINGGVAQTKTAVEGIAEATRQSTSRLEAQLRAPAAGGKTDLGELPQKLGRLEVSVAAIAQRLEHSEMQKSVLRLEDGTRELRAEVQQLLKGDVVRQATTDLQKRLEQSTQSLSQGLQQLREGNLGELDAAVRQVLREVSGIATTVAQLQANVRAGARPAAATETTPAPVPAAVATTAPAPAQASAPAPAPVAATAPASGDAASSGAEAGGYQTGKRTVGSKNVLGAIAKLKQMKG
jgi:hypothetical protein